MTTAFDYRHPFPSAASGEVLGMDVAIESLLKGWFRWGRQRPFLCRPEKPESYAAFERLAEEAGRKSDECLGLDPTTPQENLASLGCLFRPDPLLTDLIWQRTQIKGRGYATCGLVHTASGDQVSRVLFDLCLAPAASSDALICPSRAIERAVRRLWEIQADYLSHHFGKPYVCPLRTPVIPLGVDLAEMQRKTMPAKRAQQRAALGAAEDEVLLLFVGRLSFATKAHPLPLLLAAENAAKETGKKLRLVFFGYFKPQEVMEPRFKALAQDIARHVRVEFVMNSDARFPDGLWAGADLFASLIDNIQESFGLTPLEAMAAGLPCVLSDWDGYRDHIRDGEEGFLIPTLAPPPEAGGELAALPFNNGNYGSYLVSAAQSTAVSIPKATEALTLLLNDPAKRREMGQKAARRAAEVYGWHVLIPAYETLWDDLAEERRRAPLAPPVPKDWPAVHPAFPNPFDVFESFPTRTLCPDDLLIARASSEEALALLHHDMNAFMPELLCASSAVPALLETIGKNAPSSVRHLLASAPAKDRPRMLRVIGWLLKTGLCELIN